MATRVYKIGSGVTDVPGDIKTGFVLTTALNNYMTFESVLGTDLQVTAGKTLYITRLHYFGNTISQNFWIGYGDTGVGDGAPAPTNPVQVTRRFANLVAQEEMSLDVFIPIPAEKFPVCRRVLGANEHYVQIEGVEI